MTEKNDRREFFKDSFSGMKGFVKNFTATQIEEVRNCIRPPGAIEEFTFLLSCTRCRKCRSACPEGIIDVFHDESGGKKLFTPYVDPNKSPCTFCGACVEVCETGALDPEVLIKDKKIGKATIRTNICITHKNVMCSSCKYCCPESAISFKDFMYPVIDEEKCTGCGICVNACIEPAKGIWVTHL